MSFLYIYRYTYKYDKPKVNAQQSKQELRFLLSYLLPHKWKLIVALVCMLAGNGILLAFPTLIGDIVDSFGSGAADVAGGAIGLLLGLLVAQTIVQYFVSTALATVSEEALARMRADLYERLMFMPMSLFIKRRVGELSSRLSNDMALIQETLTFTTLEILRQGVFLIGGIIVIATMSFRLTSVILLAIPFLLLVALIFSRFIRKYSMETQDALAQAATTVQETLQGAATVKSFVKERAEIQRYVAQIRRGVEVALSGAKTRAVFGAFMTFAIFGGITAIIWYGGTLVQAGVLTMGDLASFLMYAMFVAGSLGSLGGLVGQVQRALGASVRIRELFASQPEDVGEVDPKTELHGITAENVVFTYPGSGDEPAIDNVSLDIAPGRRVAFVGGSGAGKSTMAHLVQQFYRPDSGRILFDGVDARELNVATIRNNVGTVPQDIMLFGGTIAENIAYGKPGASEEEIREAARLANAAEFIENQPDAYQTKIGERGARLSGGQRQRIAIARAILKNTPILILDEATSALDAKSERLIQEALDRLMHGRTTIIIAHRLSTIRDCDCIYVFSQGRIVESGTHDQLLSQPQSLYAKLCEYQFGKD